MTNLRWKLAILVNIRFCFLCYGGLNDNRANSDSGSITSGLIFALDISRDVENLALRTLRSSLRRSITLIAPSSVCIIIAKCCRQRFSKTFDDCLSTFSYPASTPGRLDRIIEKTLPVMFACKENKPRIPEMKKNQKNSDYLILFTNAAEQKEEHRMIEKAVEGRRLRCAVIYINGIEKRERKAQDEFIAYLKKRIASGPELLFQADNFQQLSSVLRMAILAGKNISQNSNSGDSTDGFEEMSSHRNLAKQHTPTMNKNFTRRYFSSQNSPQNINRTTHVVSSFLTSVTKVASSVLTLMNHSTAIVASMLKPLELNSTNSAQRTRLQNELHHNPFELKLNGSHSPLEKSENNETTLENGPSRFKLTFTYKRGSLFENRLEKKKRSSTAEPQNEGHYIGSNFSYGILEQQDNAVILALNNMEERSTTDLPVFIDADKHNMMPYSDRFWSHHSLNISGLFCVVIIYFWFPFSVFRRVYYYLSRMIYEKGFL